jgi:hypothetical protein
MRGIHMSSAIWSFVDCNRQQPTTNMKLCSHGETLSPLQWENYQAILILEM